MHADTRGAALIASAAAQFDWTWSRSDLDRFTNAMGWHCEFAGKTGASFVTNLDIDRPEAHADFGGLYFEEWNDTLASIEVYVVDFVAPAGKFTIDAVAPDEIVFNIQSVVNSISQGLGEPILDEDGPDVICQWEFENVVIAVEVMQGLITLNITDPKIKEWLASISDEDDC